MKDMKNRIAYFSALCFFLSAIEMAIPKPLPFMRLGLANLPIMASLALLSAKETVLLIFLKVLLQAFVSGTLFSYVFLFSLAGTVASGFGMLMIYRLLGGKRALVSWFGVSLFGGLMNNLAQILVAKFVMFGDNISYVAPLLLAAGFVCSGLLGVFMNLFWKNSRFVKLMENESTAGNCPTAENCPNEENCPTEAQSGATEERSFTCVQDDTSTSQHDSALCQDTSAPGQGDSTDGVIPRASEESPSWQLYASLLFALAAFVVLLITSSLYVVYGIFLLFLILNAIKYKKVRILSPLLIIASVTFLELLSPAGKILWQYGSFKVTDIPLVSGLLKSGRLCAMVVVSRFAVNRQIHLPGKAGNFVSQVFAIFGELNGGNSGDCTDKNPTGKTDNKAGKTTGNGIKKDRKSLTAYIDMRLCEVWQNVNQC